MEPSTALAWGACFVGISVLGTWVALRYAHHRGLIDQPGERRSHVVPTPRGGGIGIVIAVLSAMAWLAWHQHAAYGWTCVGLALVALVGWIDDHRSLSIKLRLSVHALAGAALAWACHLSGMPGWGCVLGLMLAMVLINVWNFMDGIDGIAASQAMIAACGYALLLGHATAGLLALALAAACLGFLPFNFPRARIFMGDVGSGALGYALACIVMLGAGSTQMQWLPILALPLSGFLADSTLTLLMRMRRGERWWTAHVSHVYQGLSRVWGSHRSVTMAYACWSAVAAAVMLACSKGGWMPSTLATTCVFSLSAGAWSLARRHIQSAGRAE